MTTKESRKSLRRIGVAIMRLMSFLVRISTMTKPMPHMLPDMSVSPTSPGTRKSMYRAPGSVTCCSAMGVGSLRPSARCRWSSTRKRAMRASGRVASKRYVRGSPGMTTRTTLPLRRSRLAPSASSTFACTSFPSSAARTCSALAPSSMATFTASGGRLRKAMPRATARMMGKPKVQKTALGSRKKRRRRATDSSTSADLTRPSGRRPAFDRISVTQSPPRQRDEHVFQRRVARREALELLPS